VKRPRSFKDCRAMGKNSFYVVLLSKGNSRTRENMTKPIKHNFTERNVVAAWGRRSGGTEEIRGNWTDYEKILEHVLSACIVRENVWHTAYIFSAFGKLLLSFVFACMSKSALDKGLLYINLFFMNSTPMWVQRTPPYGEILSVYPPIYFTSQTALWWMKFQTDM
jgi:hypothetical protein